PSRTLPREAAGHRGSIRHTDDIDPRGIDRMLADDGVDHGVEVAHVVDRLELLPEWAAIASVVPDLAYGARHGEHECLLVGQRGISRPAIELERLDSPSMQREKEWLRNALFPTPPACRSTSGPGPG